MKLSCLPAAQLAEPASLAARLTLVPRVVDLAQAHARFDDFLSGFDSDAGARELIGGEKVRALLLAIADHSPFLWRLITADAGRLHHLLCTEPEARLDEILRELAEAAERMSDQPSLMRLLRRARQELALLIALADLGGIWCLDEVTQALSRAAETFVRCALRFLLREAHSRGRLLCDGAHLEEECGVVVLALGKLGAGELNYSSDVD
ncbi:MAG: bifunctional [glutamine synthetase] adenylyltransferase/[glutamine synthetase]-adenylyl-L-tyrosine phosphorylase, partial [Methylobacteriaceae bacterium]|nr:bifunctional [glutamine synthetase] adenylyltransferase/[glutamine synthetase]-adenylyl-L-tyrosine phosphorylase [Methylobacteriaceae bacterium]